MMRLMLAAGLFLVCSQAVWAAQDSFRDDDVAADDADEDDLDEPPQRGKRDRPAAAEEASPYSMRTLLLAGAGGAAVGGTLGCVTGGLACLVVEMVAVGFMCAGYLALLAVLWPCLTATDLWLPVAGAGLLGGAGLTVLSLAGLAGAALAGAVTVGTATGAFLGGTLAAGISASPGRPARPR